MISIEFALEIHSLLIKEFGGKPGLRYKPGLEAALARPFASFGGKDLYDSPIHKAAALLESIIKNHPFVDGNKRTGYFLGRLFLLNNGLDIQASENQKYDFVMSIASGQFSFDQIEHWLLEHVG